MGNGKKKNVVIGFLVIVIILLVAALVYFLCIRKDNHDETFKPQECEQINDKEDINLINSLVGSYTYKGEYVNINDSDLDNIKNDAYTSGKMATEYLKLDASGKATCDAGNLRSGSYNAKGNWYISNDEIIVINDDCKPIGFDNTNNIVNYPNCQPIWYYKYKIENGKAVITSTNNGEATVTLNKD